MSPRRFLTASALSLAVVLPTAAHIDGDEPLQSLRQSYFALVGMNFGPMADMVKGKIEWDQATFEGWATDLAAIAGTNVERGFAPGSSEGKTRAKPEIWENMDDFKEKLAELREQTALLAEAAGTGDREAIGAQLGATGKACKSCHDDYKSKDYLY
ncbi:cytochrome c, class II [Luminiphilus syltensis NOR5-1B]|uniref:Cytochrome c, class II n=1 Tax=Luminiphilus syltensis NOR5-1B TaxID=565045 RepID=B8KRI6_9GAMM|nr:cytochrome c [Luminiphilus syltensis]EED36309.1 cytochrome c, class II [Luminiphilus syltensis NOR5-1B]